MSKLVPLLNQYQSRWMYLLFFLHSDFSNSFTEQMVTVGRWAKGMSADHEDILDVPKPQKPKTKIPKVVNF